MKLTGRLIAKRDIGFDLVGESYPGCVSESNNSHGVNGVSVDLSNANPPLAVEEFVQCYRNQRESDIRNAYKEDVAAHVIIEKAGKPKK
ncbi:hypothetical protein [Ramlibacter rhizophilus]|uniref:Uncharacterized protein n=1 Tax=Ramlibacter rhizophilus TaxID=1781167 RepID=A0A4Z0BU04_9BURK|nr:hypothetical protein [Ramlibacter rhizophilus]TFZ01469.1 hypothetical protein EZ242_08845 [Ramlibacter rhizophilus]